MSQIICPKTGRICEVTGCFYGSLCFNPPEKAYTYPLMGWECPRCRTIHAPFVRQCDCPAPSYTSTTIQLEP